MKITINKQIFALTGAFILLIASCKEEKIGYNGKVMVYTSKAENIYETAADIKGEVSVVGNIGITESGFVMSKDTLPDLNDKVIAIKGRQDGKLHTTLSDLSTNTKYYVATYTKTDEGVIFGNNISFTTLPTIEITVTLNEVQQEQIKKYSAELTGTLSVNRKDVVIDELGICYGVKQEPNINTAEKQIGEAAPGDFSMQLIGLDAGTSYYARSYVNALGKIIYGNEVKFTTLEKLTGAAAREQDSLALVALYNATNGANWKYPWTLTKKIDQWRGVKIKNERVVGIRLSFQKLKGTLPSEMGDLDELKELSIRFERELKGSLPATMMQLKKLEKLELAITGVGGEMPTWIGKLPALKIINLTNCNFEGVFPESCYNLTNLERLQLSNNHNLKGVLSAQVANWSKLHTLSLVSCGFYGNIPEELNNLTNLRLLDLRNNNFEGSIINSFSQLKALKYIKLSNNKLVIGDLAKFLNGKTLLQELDVTDCGVTGSIPDNIGTYLSLEVLAMGKNDITGTIPASLSNLKKLTHLIISENKFTGTFPSLVLNLKSLWMLGLGGNKFTGKIPNEIGDKLPNLGYLDLGFNQLEGPIPESIGKMTQGKDPNGFPWEPASGLKSLYLNNNNLTGSIPASFGKLKKLEYLNLTQNKLSGQIPEEVKKHPYYKSKNWDIKNQQTGYGFTNY